MHGFRRIEGYHSKSVIAEGPGLTAREEQILGLVAQGKGNKEIGEHLGISLRTVKVHMTNIFEKLGVNRRMDAVELLYVESRWQDARAS